MIGSLSLEDKHLHSTVADHEVGRRRVLVNQQQIRSYLLKERKRKKKKKKEKEKKEKRVERRDKVRFDMSLCRFLLFFSIASLLFLFVMTYCFSFFSFHLLASLLLFVLLLPPVPPLYLHSATSILKHIRWRSCSLVCRKGDC